jgi:hypothetical protein
MDNPPAPSPIDALTTLEGTVTTLGATLPAPADLLQQEVTAAVADTLHKIDIRSHLELLARTDPRTFRAWVQMALPQARAGAQQANIINVHSALPKSALDALPPGFDIHR